MTPRTQCGHKESGTCFFKYQIPTVQEVPFIKKSVFLCWLDKAGMLLLKAPRIMPSSRLCSIHYSGFGLEVLVRLIPASFA